MGWNFTRSRVWKILIILQALFFTVEKAAAQGGSPICGPTVPSFNVNLSGQPGGTWVSSPPIQRGGLCCNAQSPDRCVEFNITLDVGAVGINFDIASGAVPPGALYYQIDCGPMIPVGQPICLNGPGPYRLTFCKPGNNINTYSITSIPAPVVSPATTTSDGCNIKIGASGLIESSVTWTSIAPGTQGQYNAYLNCVAGCDTVQVTPQTGYPAYVDYKVCGNPLGGVCFSSSAFCDTIRVYFVPPIANAISPNPASYCVNQPGVTLNSVINGGLAPYSYIWTNSVGAVVGTNNTYFATSPGSYMLEVRDATYPGCPAKFSTVTVTVTPMPSANAGPDRRVCPGNPNVTLAGTVTNATGGIWSGGTGVFTPSSTALNAVYTPSASEVAAGMAVLTLTTTGNGACAPVSDQMTITITQPLTATINAPTVVCYGATANISVTAGGGTPPYQYSWNTGQTTQGINNVAPGSYSVTVTDATQNACTITKGVSIPQNPPVSLSVPSNTIISCDSSVAITISANGGAGNFSYLWNTGATGPTITVNSGTYIITATDQVGCSNKDTIVIQAAGSAISASIAPPSVLCYGGSTTLFASGSGGWGGYNYTWTNGSLTSTTVAGAGNHCVTVQDTVGCLYTACVSVTEAPQLTVSIPTPPIICYGSTTTIAANPSGGTPPYNYSWSTGETTASIIKPAGTYSVTVTDANSNVCSATASVTITQASNLTLNFNPTHVSCYGGNNGMATVTVTGGVGPYNYGWSPYGGYAATAYSLGAGTYTVTIVDALGCSKTGTVTITQPPLLTASISSSTNVTCAGNANGTATVSASGGTPGYSFFWTPTNETGTMALSLAAGTNSVVVTDSKGCNATASVVISQPPALTAAIGNSSNVSCNGGNNGSATVMASGGTPNYSYTWLETGDNTPTVSNLYFGNYNISISDAQGCVTTTSVSISQPPALTSSISGSANVTCFGAANGSATVTVNGGSPGYNYSWSPTGGTGSTASQLGPNSYMVTVTDIKGCQTTSTVLITQPSPLTFSSASATAATCAGTCNGMVSVAASGSNGQFQYFWTPGSYTNSNVTGLCAGNYTVRATDALGCFRDTILSVTEPPALSLATNFTGSNCGQPNGSASVAASGGTPSYSYTWSTLPVQYNAVASNLTPGTYTITVKDSKACPAQAVVTVPNIPGVTASVGSSTNITCYGLCNGTATVTGTGGSGPYLYSWSTTPVQSSTTATNLCPGTYIVKITGSDGCSDTASVTITQPPLLQIATDGTSNVNCFGGITGSASVSASGGVGPYSFIWNTNPVQYGQSASGLSAGIYTATATDTKGCVDTVQIPIYQPAAPLQVSTNQTNINCFGGNTGSATVSVTGGTAPYTYSWNTSPVQTTPTATALYAGTYSATITDSKGCIVSTPLLILTQPPAALAVSVTDTDVLCYGNNSGTAQATVTGGSAPYTYSWSTSPMQTSPSANTLGAGTYSVSITDSKGCVTTSAPVIISQPNEALSLSVASTNVNCFGQSTGTAAANVTGGTFPYSYSWSTSPSQTTQSIQNLPAGAYSVLVTDNNGCTISQANITITQPNAALSGTTSQQNVNCFGGNNGSATITMSGGTTPYTYSWNTNPVQTNSQASNLSAGTYSITVTDNKGCVFTPQAVIITQPAAALAVTLSQTNVNCFGMSTGSASATVTGGTTPYTYSWSTSPAQYSPSISNLAAGTYSLSVTDNKGCNFSSMPIIISQPASALTLSVTSTDVACYGAQTGTATATVQGGTMPYTYSWSSNPVQTTATASNLGFGIYSIVITDNNGCTASQNQVGISQPTAALTSTVIKQNVSCNGGNNGSAQATVSGGVSPYTYSWSTSPSQNTALASNLVSGTYSVVVTDANGCTLTSQPVTITEPASALSVVQSQTNVDCFGMNTGTASVSVTGGTSPYTYSWSTSPVQQNPTAFNLAAGYYTVKVTDNNGCVFTSQPILITQPSAALQASASSTNIKCYGINDGTATAVVYGGTSPYTYSWNSTPSQTTATASNLVAGTYWVRVTDSKGCVVGSDTVTVTQPLPLDANITNMVNASCYDANNGSATVGVTGGTFPYYYSWSTNPSQTLATASNLASGSYSATVTDLNGCKDSVTVIIGQPASIVFVSAGSFQTTCNESCDGYALVIVGGGTAPYSYSWSNGATGPSINNLCTGYYSVTVMDQKGCFTDTVLQVTGPPPVLLSTTTVPSNCYQPNGSASATPSGGMAAYSFSWSTTPSQFGSTATGLTPGSYNVLVTDARGCQSNATVVIENIPGVKVTSTTNQAATCRDTCNGTATVSVATGITPYTYFWNTSPPQFSSTAVGLCAGTYKITVKDSAGCWDTASVVINEPAAVNVMCVDTPRICIGELATLTASAEGGNGVFNYNWNNGACTTAVYIVSPGNTTSYQLYASDTNGCRSQMFTVPVIVNDALTFNVVTRDSICPGETATITAEASGGDGSYSYTWYPSGITGNTLSASPSSTSTFSVTVKDGCGSPEVTVPSVITVHPLPQISFTEDKRSGCKPLCVNFNNTSTIENGSITSFSWEFSNGQSSTSFDPEMCFDKDGFSDLSVEAVSNHGCRSKSTFANYVEVHPDPVADFVLGPQPADILNPLIKFTDQSSDAVAWEWLFNDRPENKTSNEQHPVCMYSDTGDFCPVLKVTNQYGCVNTKEKCLYIQPDFAFYVPNAFSPNNDGVNETFSGVGVLVQEYEMMIFDRWGNLLYQTDDVNKPWDGRANGGADPAEEDVYVYRIWIKDINGKPHQFDGTVTIVK